MKKLSFLVLVVPFFLLGQDNSNFLINMTQIEVKMGHEPQFEEGVKMYKKCYAESGGEGNWNFWRRIQGLNSVYGVTSRMDSWAEMDDENDEAANTCRSMFPSFILPHMKSTENTIATAMVDISNDSTEPMDKVWVTYFRVKHPSDFMSVIRAISAEIKKVEGDERAYWYAIVGGSTEAADYMVVSPFNKFADLDKDQEGVWDIYEKAQGKKKTEEMRAKFSNALDDSWAYIFDKSDEMSKAD